MPAGIESGTPKHLGVLGLLFSCRRWCVGRIETDDHNVVVDTRLHRNPTQTGDSLPQAHRAETWTLEIHERQHDRLLAEVSPERYTLPALVMEDKVERNRRIQLLFQVHAFGNLGTCVLPERQSCRG